MKSVILFFILTLPFFSCSADFEDSMDEREALIESVTVADTVSQDFYIDMKVSVPGCWSYSRLEQRSEGDNNIFFQAYVRASSGKRNDDIQDCTSGTFTESISEYIVLKDTGNVNLIFGESIIKEVYVVERKQAVAEL